MARPDPHRLFLFDLGPILRDEYERVTQEHSKAPKGTPEHEYWGGEVIALGWVIGMLQQQADGFGIPHSDLRLDGVVTPNSPSRSAD